jgi:hypothetical protein
LKSLLNALKEEDRLRILIKEIEKDDEATKDFKSQHLNNIQSFLKATEIPDDWCLVVGITDVNPILHRITVDFDIYSGFPGKLLMMFSVESYIYDDIKNIWIKNLNIHYKKFVFTTESYLSKEEFIDLIRVYEIIQKQNKKGGDLE